MSQGGGESKLGALFQRPFSINRRKKSEAAPDGMGEEASSPTDSPSEATRQRVSAAKSYIENMYKAQSQNIQERYARFAPARRSQPIARPAAPTMPSRSQQPREQPAPRAIGARPRSPGSRLLRPRAPAPALRRSSRKAPVEEPPCRACACACRRGALEEELEREGITEEEKQRIIAELEKRERDYTRLQRQRMSADDFEPLTIIGRGAFGEVGLVQRWLAGWGGVGWGKCGSSRPCINEPGRRRAAAPCRPPPRRPAA
jgi:hypothetical protein